MFGYNLVSNWVHVNNSVPIIKRSFSYTAFRLSFPVFVYTLFPISSQKEADIFYVYIACPAMQQYSILGYDFFLPWNVNYVM